MKNILWITIAISFAFQLSSSPVEAGWPSVDFPSDTGITLQKGSTYNILWSSVNTEPVDIKLCNEIEPSFIDCSYDIARNVPNNGQYSWTVPTSLPNGSNYVISVGKVPVSAASSDFPFTISDRAQTPLLPPRLSYTIDGVRASISWTFVSGATGYKFYYAPSPFSGPESIAEIDMSTQTTLSADLWEGASFLVAVQSYNDQDNSNYSNIETITIPYTIPDPPQLTYNLDKTKLNANWGSVPGAAGYKLYYALSAYTGQEAFQSFDLGNQTSFSFDGLGVGQTYSIAVTSYNTAGESSFSNIETFTPTAIDSDPADPLIGTWIDPNNNITLIITNNLGCNGTAYNYTGKLYYPDFIDGHSESYIYVYDVGSASNKCKNWNLSTVEEGVYLVATTSEKISIEEKALDRKIIIRADTSRYSNYKITEIANAEIIDDYVDGGSDSQRIYYLRFLKQ